MIADTVIARNLRRELDRAGRTAKAVSLDAGLNATFCADILRGKAKNPAASRLAAVAKALGISVSSLTEDTSTAPAPSSVTIRASRGEKGALHLEIPGSASLPQDEAIKLLQLYGAAPPATRRSAMLQLQHPGLSTGASSFTDDQLEIALEEALAMLDLDRLHRAELLRALLTAVRRLRRGESGPTTKDQTKAKRARSLQSA